MATLTAGAGLGGPPTVAFREARRPEAATQVQLDEWEGPLGLLLSLIEARQFDVLTVPLGALAGAYLEALATLDGDRMGNISAFISVASQLILIKSRALLPRRADPAAAVRPEEELDPEAELRARLILYRSYRDAGGRLLETAAERFGLFRREPRVAAAAGLAGARPADGPPLDPVVLVTALDGLARVVPEPPRPPETVRRTITLTERAAMIRRALADAPSIVLQDLLRGVRDRVVVAVTFLAMLELVKRREIVIEQAEPFGPIVVRRPSLEERGATEEAAAPIDETLGSFA